MDPWTRKALNLPPNATDAAAAAALDKDGHGVTMRQLEKKDGKLLMTLRASFFPTYNRLYKAQYGVDAKPITGKNGLPTSEKIPAKTDLAAAFADALTLDGWRTGREAIPVTLRQLEQQKPDVVLRLKHEEPLIYARLFKAQYGSDPR